MTFDIGTMNPETAANLGHMVRVAALRKAWERYLDLMAASAAASKEGDFLWRTTRGGLYKNLLPEMRRVYGEAKSLADAARSMWRRAVLDLYNEPAVVWTPTGCVLPVAVLEFRYS
jgi:hypothetical protein